ncbi:hypothetical protein H0H93_002143 [Arthromyces matolae]|nr:hypothetical protein H0H93_002143 [Arthromyces matolae]
MPVSTTSFSLSTRAPGVPSHTTLIPITRQEARNSRTTTTSEIVEAPDLASKPISLSTKPSGSLHDIQSQPLWPQPHLPATLPLPNFSLATGINSQVCDRSHRRAVAAISPSDGFTQEAKYRQEWEVEGNLAEKTQRTRMSRD